MTGWERTLARWQNAGLIDAESAERIRSFEEREAGPVRWRWPTIVALVFGGLMLAAGVLLFVAARRAVRSEVLTNSDRARLSEPVAFFIPEHAPDPSRRDPGEELWGEVTRIQR